MNTRSLARRPKLIGAKGAQTEHVWRDGQVGERETLADDPRSALQRGFEPIVVHQEGEYDAVRVDRQIRRAHLVEFERSMSWLVHATPFSSKAMRTLTEQTELQN